MMHAEAKSSQGPQSAANQQKAAAVAAVAARRCCCCFIAQVGPRLFTIDLIFNYN